MRTTVANLKLKEPHPGYKTGPVKIKAALFSSFLSLLNFLYIYRTATLYSVKWPPLIQQYFVYYFLLAHKFMKL